MHKLIGSLSKGQGISFLKSLDRAISVHRSYPSCLFIDQVSVSCGLITNMFFSEYDWFILLWVNLFDFCIWYPARISSRVCTLFVGI